MAGARVGRALGRPVAALRGEGRTPLPTVSARHARDAEDVRRRRDREERGRVEAALHALDLEAGGRDCGCRVARRAAAARALVSRRAVSPARWTARNPALGDRTCSQKRSSPPGTSTRLSSASAAPGSATLQSTPMSTAASNDSSSTGSASATPSTSSIGTAAVTGSLGRCTARRRVRLDREQPVDRRRVVLEGTPVAGADLEHPSAKTCEQPPSSAPPRRDPAAAAPAARGSGRSATAAARRAVAPPFRNGTLRR